MDEKDRPVRAKVGLAKFRHRSGSGGAWAGPRWYLAYLIPFEAAMVIVIVRGGEHNAWYWKVLGIGLIVISCAVLAANAIAVRKRKREGWVPVKGKSRPDVAGIRLIGQWRRPEHEE